MFTPARFILALPSNETPPIVRAVARVVAVFARAMAIFAEPLKLVPPIVLAVCSKVAVPALPEISPVTFPVKAPAKASEVTVPSKKAFLNSKLDVPKSMSLLVTGTIAPSINLICCALAA